LLFRPNVVHAKPHQQEETRNSKPSGRAQCAGRIDSIIQFLQFLRVQNMAYFLFHIKVI
jgi:hypothetical protein